MTVSSKECHFPKISHERKVRLRSNVGDQRKKQSDLLIGEDPTVESLDEPFKIDAGRYIG